METILLVEDDPAVRTLTERILIRAGYSVLVACDGQEACFIFEKHFHEIDLILMDMLMPKMGGREAYEEMIRMRSDVPVILCSGMSEHQLDHEFLFRNSLNLLAKPFCPDELLTRVRNRLRVLPCAA